MSAEQSSREIGYFQFAQICAAAKERTGKKKNLQTVLMRLNKKSSNLS